MSENTKEVIFPATDAAGEAKLKGLIDKIADYMDVKIDYKTKVVMAVNYPADCIGMDAILKRLAGNKTGLRQNSQKTTAETK